jgi:hypothetical protein
MAHNLYIQDDQAAMMYVEAGAKAMDRYWQSGPFNVQRWAERAFVLAISRMRETEPIAGEPPADYLQRVAEKVRTSRNDGPDDDDEEWFAGAIDDACRIMPSVQVAPERAFGQTQSSP